MRFLRGTDTSKWQSARSARSTKSSSANIVYSGVYSGSNRNLSQYQMRYRHVMTVPAIISLALPAAGVGPPPPLHHSHPWTPGMARLDPLPSPSAPSSPSLVVSRPRASYPLHLRLLLLLFTCLPFHFHQSVLFFPLVLPFFLPVCLSCLLPDRLSRNRWCLPRPCWAIGSVREGGWRHHVDFQGLQGFAGPCSTQPHIFDVR